MNSFSIKLVISDDVKFYGNGTLYYEEPGFKWKKSVLSPNRDGLSWIIGIVSLQRWSEPWKLEITPEKQEQIINRIKEWGLANKLMFTVDDGSLGKKSHEEMLAKGYTVMTYSDGSIRYIPPNA